MGMLVPASFQDHFVSFSDPRAPHFPQKGKYC